MSHGASTEEVAEPNLMSMLDLVLQLLMFFLIVANFVAEQNNQDIKLPEATTAVPIDAEQKDTISLNVDQNGNLVISDSGKEEAKLNSEFQIELYLKDTYSKLVSKMGKEEDVKKMIVVVRGDNRAEFEHIYRVMAAAKKANFPNVMLRANRPAGK